MNKQELQEQITELQTTLNSLELNTERVKKELVQTTATLRDINKPAITEQMSDAILQVLQMAFEYIDLNDFDPEYEFEIDYDGRIIVNTASTGAASHVVDRLHDAIIDLFRVQPDATETEQ